MLKIVTISDTHGKHWTLTNNDRLPKGDIIIHAGDCSPSGRAYDIEEFLKWYGDLDYDKKILIAGNHDWGFERDPEYLQELCDNYNITYLNDSGCTVKGIKIWGSPVQPEFCNWAFNKQRGADIKKHWDLIPKGTEILITHGPPWSFCDEVEASYSSNKGLSVGCVDLFNRIEEVKPVLHVFGHIHEARGVMVNKASDAPVTHVNTSTLDECYTPWHEDAYVFDWDKLLTGDSKGRDY